ncbi:calcium-binding protein [Sphingobium sp. HBC34]|uniref:Calcium-binding protein n=1 Tax=Sphingobium cyanobacteriorum TaxID=3063954 RepID=A0ABT8ZM02_9SPHN|nr:calcium-binding protein [Sphingobium sp. HBC34]MDO7835251.1 calcium-binding protein [Sphingobium sp. HBC34]
MADITIHLSNRNTGFTTRLAQFYGAQTSTNFEVISASGILLEANIGTNFTYSGGFFRTGTIYENYLFAANGELAFSATGLNLDVAARNNSLQVGQSQGGYYRLLGIGDDVVTGSSGDDFLFGSKGNDHVDGGTGLDILSYNGFEGAVTVNLATRTAETAFGVSTLVGIEDVEGSAFADTLTGDVRNNLLQGFGGNDIIDGRGGLDTASYLDAASAVSVNLTLGTATGGSGSDTLVSIERVIGSRFNDMLLGSAANEFFVGGQGNDTINGGGGIDTVEYGNVGFGVEVNLSTGKTSGGAGIDTLTSIENVLGSIFGDVIIGNTRDNMIRGGAGNDVLVGGTGVDQLYGDAGNDRLRGGIGNDWLQGGAGKDAFQFDTALGTSNAANIDFIDDFSPLDDTLYLENSVFSAFGTTTGAINAAHFRSIVTGGATDANDFLVYDRSTGALFYDANGSVNGLGDAVQFATLLPNLQLTSSDFLLI